MTAKAIDDCFVLDKDRIAHAEAVGILKARIQPVTGVEDVPLAAASGRILGEDIVSARPIPGHDNAAVDGYAFAWADYDPQSGQVFPIAGEAAAGHPFEGDAPAGVAIRIFTGAIMPAGLDTIAMQEDVRIEERDGQLWAHIPPGLKSGANRRRAGEDAQDGETLLTAGARLRPQDVATAAAVGRPSLACHRRLNIAVFSTGDEVLRPGEAFSRGKVYDANAPMLHALIEATGAAATGLGVLPDTAERVTAALSDASKTADAIIVSGGASQGREDHVVAALKALGRCHLWQIAIKPGRPMCFGQIGKCLVLCLPGNPVAVFVCYLMYVHPALTRLGGGTWPEPVRYAIPADFDQKKKPGRREFWRARLVHRDGTLRVAKFPRDGSGLISSLREADGLIELAEDVEQVRAGESVDFIPFTEFGIAAR